MKLPKYLEKKIFKRAELQERASVLQREIEEWCEKHNIELQYAVTHICLFNEPMMVALDTIETIKNAEVGRRDGE